MKMRFAAVFLALPAMLLGLRAHAAIDTGNDLYQACTDDSPYGRGRCVGTVVGFLEGQHAGYFRGTVASVSATFEGDRGVDDAKLWKEVTRVKSRMAAQGKENPDCVPGEATIKQLTDLVVKWLKNNPEKRAESISYAFNTAFREAFGFPCNTE